MKKLCSLLLFLIVIIYSNKAQNISQWRGPDRDGIYKETKLLKTWPAEGPKLLWINESIGDGYGSPAVTSDMIFINGMIDSTSYVFAFDLQGKLVWKSPNGKDFVGSGFTSRFPGSRSTPTVYDNLVYACSANGRIACFEKQTGKEKWAKEIIGDLHGNPNGFGYSESLLIDKDKIFFLPGGTNNFAVALDRNNGNTIWMSKGFNDTIAYSSPILV